MFYLSKNTKKIILECGHWKEVFFYLTESVLNKKIEILKKLRTIKPKIIYLFGSVSVKNTYAELEKCVAYEKPGKVIWFIVKAAVVKVQCHVQMYFCIFSIFI